MADFVYDAFDLADKYRTPVLILADGALGQMMEKVEFREYVPADHIPPKPWATTGKLKGQERKIVTSLHMQPEMMEEVNRHLQAKFARIAGNEVRYELIAADDAEYLVVAYGLAARVAHRAVQLARAEGIRVGLLRPITLWPYPSAVLASLAPRLQGLLVVEMNAGQMVEDVRLAVEGRAPVHFYGRMGGVIPGPDEVVVALRAIVHTEVAQAAEAH
jgi:2-oxoglutarate ferredoxin oxidoreductase subunit alpha